MIYALETPADALENFEPQLPRRRSEGTSWNYVDKRNESTASGNVLVLVALFS